MFHYLTISSRGSPFLVDRPLVVQMAGDDPAIMLAAAKLVEHQCDAFDINLGCPQRIAYTGANVSHTVSCCLSLSPTLSLSPLCHPVTRHPLLVNSRSQDLLLLILSATGPHWCRRVFPYVYLSQRADCICCANVLCPWLLLWKPHVHTVAVLAPTHTA